jgi:hypothetical protein
MGTNFTKNQRTKIQEQKLQKFGNKNYINLGTKITKIQEQKLQKSRNKNYKKFGNKNYKNLRTKS